MAYAIAEVPATSTIGFSPRGGAFRLWHTKSHEVMLSGPAETGKTFACLQKLDALCWKYSGIQAAIVRKTYASMHGTVLQTYRRILGRDTPVRAFGGEKPEWFDYPNGSRVFVGGMDNPQKVLSGERDVIYVNQAEELLLDDWETLTTRCTGRAGVMPYPQIIGDCNPGPATHWIKGRAGTGALEFLESSHEDNPTLYSDDGKLTEQGRRTMSILDALTGTRHKRLRLGQWVGAEGQVYEEWDPAVHLIEHVPGHPEWRKDSLPAEWPRYRVIDFGYTNPFVCLWGALDPDGRLYVYRELYQTQRLVESVVPDILRLSEGERITDTLADHDAEDRATAQAHGLRTRPAQKDVGPGIQAVQSRLKVAGDGKPRLYVFRDVLCHVPDQNLLDRRKPVRTAEEFDGYIWAKSANADKIKEEPVKQDDHGLDALRYLVYHLDAAASVGVFL
jgi:PBSX family phage terminase large subunit